MQATTEVAPPAPGRGGVRAVGEQQPRAGRIVVEDRHLQRLAGLPPRWSGGQDPRDTRGVAAHDGIDEREVAPGGRVGRRQAGPGPQQQIHQFDAGGLAGRVAQRRVARLVAVDVLVRIGAEIQQPRSDAHPAGGHRGIAAPEPRRTGVQQGRPPARAVRPGRALGPLRQQGQRGLLGTDGRGQRQRPVRQRRIGGQGGSGVRIADQRRVNHGIHAGPHQLVLQARPGREARLAGHNQLRLAERERRREHLGDRPPSGAGQPRDNPGRRVNVATLMGPTQVLRPLALLREIRPCHVGHVTTFQRSGCPLAPGGRQSSTARRKAIRDGRSPFRGPGALSGAQPIYNVSASTDTAKPVLTDADEWFETHTDRAAPQRYIHRNAIFGGACPIPPHPRAPSMPPLQQHQTYPKAMIGRTELPQTTRARLHAWSRSMIGGLYSKAHRLARHAAQPPGHG